MNTSHTSRPGLDTQQIQEVYQQYVETFSNKQPEQIVNLHAEQGTFWLRAGREPVRGREAISAAFAEFFRTWPQLGFKIHRTLFTPSGWVLDWSVTASLPGKQGGKHPIQFDALDVVDVDERGLVIRKDTFIDSIQLKAALSSLDTSQA